MTGCAIDRRRGHGCPGPSRRSRRWSSCWPPSCSPARHSGGTDTAALAPAARDGVTTSTPPPTPTPSAQPVAEQPVASTPPPLAEPAPLTTAAPGPGSATGPAVAVPEPELAPEPEPELEPEPEPEPEPAPAPEPDPEPVADAVAEPGTEGEVLALVNAERNAAGCGPLSAGDGLAQLARAHSADMRDRGYFSHADPDGRSPWDRAGAAGVGGLRAENIARGQADAAAVVAGWMASPGHRANILDCSLTTLGVGVARGAGGPWWTQAFGG